MLSFCVLFLVTLFPLRVEPYIQWTEAKKAWIVRYAMCLDSKGTGVILSLATLDAFTRSNSTSREDAALPVKPEAMAFSPLEGRDNRPVTPVDLPLDISSMSCVVV